MIEVLKYILLGLVQGLAEVLPVSSSAHLVIVGSILNVGDDSLAFEVFLHIASLIAILIFLWKKLWKIVKGFFRYILKKDKECRIEFNYCLYIVASMIPIVVFSLIFGDYVDKVSNSLWCVGLLLIINAAMIFLLSKINGVRKKEDLNFIDAIIIGCFQCAGTLPGISRSGSCLCGAFTRKIDKETATDYAFTMFVPAVIGAMVLKLKDFNKMNLSGNNIVLYMISFIVAGVATYFAFALLLKVIRKGKLSWFSLYCIIVGLGVIIYDLVR